MTTVYIPTALRVYTERKSTIDISAKTVEELINRFVENYPQVKRHLFAEDGSLRNYVNIFVNDQDIRTLRGRATEIADRDEVSIVPSVAGGVDPLPSLTQDEIRRYSRHLILPEVGVDGQRRLKAASVLLVGAGGLGSPVAIYLAAAGVGRLGIVDFDRVEESNLHRQIIHKSSRVGASKLASAAETLAEINPFTHVERYEVAFRSDNALEIAKDYDLVIDGTDNFPTRYLVNDVSVLLKKPNVYGSIFRFEGQASLFWAEQGPCYRCLYPEPPPPGLVPSCAEGGVLGVLPGIIGVIQATEAVKWILGIGESLLGRLLLVDALAMRFRQVALKKDPRCPLCGERPTIRSLSDYEAFCGMPAREDSGASTDDVTAPELAELLKMEQIDLIDVREPNEWDIGRIPTARLIPLGQLMERLNEIHGDRPIIAYCRSGGRSATALAMLRKAGFSSARHLQGGILKWSELVDPSVPRY